MTTQRKAVFSEFYVSYDNDLSCCRLSVTNNGGGIISFSPVLPGMAGKSPRKGEKIYDYEAKESFSINQNGATALLIALESGNAKVVSIETSYSGNKKTLSILRPKSIQLGGKICDSWMLRITSSSDEEVTKIYHKLAETEVIIDKETLSIETGKEVFTNFLKLVANNTLCFTSHFQPQKSFNSNNRRQLDDDDELPSSRKMLVEEEFID